MSIMLPNRPASGRYDGNERPVPYDLGAEEAVVGALLLDRDAIIRIATFLQPGDFYLEKNGWIYESILDLYHRREPPDLVTLSSELDRRGRLDPAGGIAYIAGLMHRVPTAVHVEYYGHIVERTSTLRRLISTGGQIAALGYEEGDDLPAVLDKAESLLFNVTQRNNSVEFQSVKDVLEEYFDKLDVVQQTPGTVVGVPTGFLDLDKITGGMQKSDLVIVAARPAVGKSSFGLSMAYNAAVTGAKKSSVALFTLEMSAEQIVQRMLSMATDIEAQRLRLGYLNDQEWQKLSDAYGMLAEAPIYIDDSAGLSIMDVRSRARRLQASSGCDMLIVDYLQLMQGRRSDNRVQEVSEITRGLKMLARELDVPVIALSQLSRAVESRTSHVPMLSDLRESGCLTGDTQVYLPDSGTYRPIEELVGQSGFNVLAMDPRSWRLEPRPVLKAFSTGTKPVFRLTTRLGRTIRATANHKFMTIFGWQRLDQLLPGIRITMPRRLSGPTEQTMSDAELALLGHLIGDGCTLPRHTIQYTSREPLLAQTTADLAKEVFGAAIEPRISAERSWYQVYLTATEHLTHNRRNPIAAWLTELGVFGLRSYEKRVPEQVFAQPDSAIAHFLRHLWSTDGCVHLSTGGQPTIYYASSSKVLARDVQRLLLRLGINAVIGAALQPGKGRVQYHVMIMGKPDMVCFLQIVGGLGENKSVHAAQMQTVLAARTANTNRDVVPREVWRLYAVPAMQEARLTTRSMQEKLGNAYCGTGLYKQNLGRERAARLAQVVESEPLKRLATSYIYWDEIVAIEADGESEVFDLTVEGLHNFVADDIVVHNSIEQDADIVMFIYREELYNPETDRKGIAEIHIAKHRNGPTGMVPLMFRHSTTRFMNLETYRQPE